MVETVEALILLLYLLPGAAGYFVFDILSERKSGDAISRIVAVVTLTLLSVFISSHIYDYPILPDISVNKTIPKILESFFGYGFLIATAVAAILGFIGAWINNKKLIYKFFMFTGITRQTGDIDP